MSGLPSHDVCRRVGCSRAELAISRQLDGRLSRRERRLLRRHLRDCEDCEAFARCQLVNRAALRSIASIPVPQTLLSFDV